MKNLALLNNITSATNPLPDDKQQQLVQLLNQLDSPQRLWLSGYLAASAVAQNQLPEQTPKGLSAQLSYEQPKLTILYGSQTGNGESVAIDLQQQAQSSGIKTELLSLADFSIKQLSNKNLITLVISTHGEGEAPEDAELFYEQLFSNKAPLLNHLKYSVLALGDSSYEFFCQTGQEIDLRLTELGAQQIHRRIDCDVDFEATATQWIDTLLPEIKTLVESENTSDNITALPLQTSNKNSTNSLINRHNPYQAEILTLQKITGQGSSKNTFHVELEIDPDLIHYQAGDSVAVLANNNSNTVQKLLGHWQQSGTEVYAYKGLSLSLLELLTEHIEITQLSKPFIQFLASQIDDHLLQEIVASHRTFETYCQDHQLIDLLQTYDPHRQVPVQEALNQLKSITPRLYSIASAQSNIEDELHLTINLEPATPTGHHGLASGMLCESAAVGDKVSIYIESNDNFRLPVDNAASIIMIGPGTGIAPFRAFIQQRQTSAASGENWLLFGNPNFASDFLYQTEWLKLQKSGFLNQLSVAFSRDQAEKIYVQDKLEEQAEKIWSWIEHGAHIYLCGDAKNMAKDVEQTLISIITEQGQLTQEAALSYLKTLKRTNRYQKDVY